MMYTEKFNKFNFLNYWKLLKISKSLEIFCDRQSKDIEFLNSKIPVNYVGRDRENLDLINHRLLNSLENFVNKCDEVGITDKNIWFLSEAKESLEMAKSGLC